MSLIPDIIESWRHPRRMVRRHLDRPPSEPFVFTFLFVFLLIAFVAQWPQAARASFLQPDVPLFQRLLASGLGLMATIPVWYGLAALSHLVARAFGGRGGWYGSRVVLFWALAVVSPAMLLQGLTAGLLGSGVQSGIVGGAVAVAFVILWLAMLIEAERAT